MSRIDLNLYAYDVLDEIQITVRVAQVDDYDLDSTTWEPLVRTRIQSTGEQDIREWARDALVAALEAL